MDEPIRPENKQDNTFAQQLRDFLQKAKVSIRDNSPDAYSFRFHNEETAQQFFDFIAKYIAIKEDKKFNNIITLDTNSINQLNNVYNIAVNFTPTKEPFGFKVLRADAFCYIHDFVEMITGGKQLPLRPGEKLEFTTMGDGVHERFEKEPIYTAQEKNGFSKANSISIATKKVASDPFGIGKEREPKLVGMIFELEDILTTKRCFLLDFGTVHRPYDSNSLNDAKSYHASMQGQLFDNLHDFIVAIERINDPSQRNEVLARLRWNIKTSKIFIATNTLEARLLAKEFARILLQRLKKLANEKRELWDPAFEIPVCFYSAGRNNERAFNHLQPYDFFQQAADRTAAYALYNDKNKRLIKYHDQSYEFLLAIDDVDSIITEILPDGQSLMVKLLNEGYVYIIQSLLARAKDPKILNKVKIPKNHGFNNKAIEHSVLAGDDRILNWVLDNGEIASGDALHYVCTRNRASMAEKLMASANFAVGKYLRIAANAGSWDVVQYFAERFRLVNTQDKDFDHALTKAAEANNTDIVEKLLLAGAKPNHVSFGHTSLHWAARHKNHRIIKLLLAKDPALLFVKNQKGKTPIDVSCDKKDLEILSYYLEQIKDPNILQSLYSNVLLIAAEKNQLQVVKDMITKGASVTRFNSKTGYGSLHWAVEHNNTDMVIILLQQGANVRKLDKRNRTPIYIAATKGQWKLVEMMLEKVDKITEEEKPYFDGVLLAAVVYPAFPEQLRIVKTLLDKGARTNCMTQDNGYSPLHWAVSLKNQPLLELLLSHPATQLNVTNKMKQFPWQFAEKTKDQTSFDCFKNYLHKYHIKLSELRDEVNKGSYESGILIFVSIPEPIRQLRELLRELPANADNLDKLPLTQKIYQGCKRIIDTQEVPLQVINAFQNHAGSAPALLSDFVALQPRNAQNSRSI